MLNKVLIGLLLIAFAVTVAWLWSKFFRLSSSKAIVGRDGLSAKKEKETSVDRSSGEELMTFELGAYDQSILNHAIQQITTVLEYTGATIDSLCDTNANLESGDSCESQDSGGHQLMTWVSVDVVGCDADTSKAIRAWTPPLHCKMANLMRVDRAVMSEKRNLSSTAVKRVDPV